MNLYQAIGCPERNGTNAINKPSALRADKSGFHGFTLAKNVTAC